MKINNKISPLPPSPSAPLPSPVFPVAAVGVAANVHIDADNYEYWCVGNCKQDVATTTVAGIAMSGEKKEKKRKIKTRDRPIIYGHRIDTCLDICFFVKRGERKRISTVGGGTDVDEAFQQQIEWSGGGDFLVLRTTGTDGDTYT